jgi:arsenate reductase
MLILGLQGSPRKGGNTDAFLGAFMDKASQAGAAVKTIQVARAGVVPCKGCGYCETHGTCVIADDPMSTEMFGLLRQADLVVAASPVYFYGVSAQLKIFIDRCQTLWSRKYVYKWKDPRASTRKGLLFSVAASQGRQLFDGVHLTTKYFFDAIDAQFSHALTYRGVESKGAIRHHESLAADIDGAIQKTVLPQVKRKQVIFISPTGACRAPMAAAMAQHRFGDCIRAEFGALRPAANCPRRWSTPCRRRCGPGLPQTADD